MKRDVFISKPNALNLAQVEFWHHIEGMLKERNLRPRSLGTTDYPNCAPVHGVRRVLTECYGCILLGFRQIHVIQGIEKAGTEKEKVLSDCYFPTAWNHIEAGMAFMLQLPILILREDGVEGGVFDIGSTDRFVHHATLSKEWITSDQFLQPFNEWYEKVINYERQNL